MKYLDKKKYLHQSYESKKVYGFVLTVEYVNKLLLTKLQADPFNPYRCVEVPVMQTLAELFDENT